MLRYLFKNLGAAFTGGATKSVHRCFRYYCAICHAIARVRAQRPKRGGVQNAIDMNRHAMRDYYAKTRY